jgi:hypothetical protein
MHTPRGAWPGTAPLHFHITATADDGTRAEHIEGAQLPAWAHARRLVHEAAVSSGSVDFDPMAGEAPFCAGLWLVRDAAGAAIASVAVSGPCYGDHAAQYVAQEVPALIAA